LAQDRLALVVTQRDGLGVEGEGATAHVAIAPLAPAPGATITTDTLDLFTMGTWDNYADHNPQSDTHIERLPDIVAW